MGVGEAGISERLRENKQLRRIEPVNQSFDGFGQPQCRAESATAASSRRQRVALLTDRARGSWRRGPRARESMDKEEERASHAHAVAIASWRS